MERIKANVHHEMTIAKKLGVNLSTRDLYSQMFTVDYQISAEQDQSN
jgi:hypothetical protein